MKAIVVTAATCLCVLLLTACATLQSKRFEPATADERAIASTIETFLSAYRVGDYATLQSLSAPDASIAVEGAGPKPLREGIVALQPESGAGILSKATPRTLVNFRQPDADSASVKNYMNEFRGEGVETAEIQWQLARQGNRWFITALSVDSSRINLHSRGGGP
jgi:hypothetical protein